ncbi:MAG: hypothetical protein NZ730_10050 [Porticoccaceae bacterium]|nr:hypothetical protein [Porticoccaceae bacterium]
MSEILEWMDQIQLKMKQVLNDQDLDEELGEHQVDLADRHAEVLEQESQESGRGRGRPAVQE